MRFFELFTPISYWILVVLSIIIISLCLKKIKQYKVLGGAVIFAFIILAIITSRTLLENLYFGIYLTSVYGLIPDNIGKLLAEPSLIMIPKSINIISDLLVIYLLVRCWEPRKIKEIKESEERRKFAANVFSSVNEGIVITDFSGQIIDLNHAFTDITGYSKEELIGKNTSILKSGRQSSEFYSKMWSSLKKNGFWRGELFNKRKNGEIYSEMLTINSIADFSGAIQNYIALFTDITVKKEHEKQLEYVAYYDPLTNLPNRKFLTELLTKSMIRYQHRNKILAVLSFDLDGFKPLNDRYGRKVGDNVLIEVSHRMKNVLNNKDNLARIDGDEFVAVIENLNSIEECELVLKQLLQVICEPIKVNGIKLQISVSIGATLYPNDIVDADQLMRHANQAMYIAKQKGKNRYQFFDTEKELECEALHKNLQRISKGLVDNEFVLFYQPKVNLKTGVVIGLEALIRWQHPKYGLLPPSEFLPIIENEPISIDVGEWVINTALKQISEWQTSGSQIAVSVNIDAMQLQQSDFATKLSRFLADHIEVHPSLLQLEILETNALGDLTNVSAIMKTCGVSFAIDDFGTGYSSLSYLRHLPANLIKIDQSFVKGMLTNEDDLAIVESIIGLAKSFKRDVIAEGVETVDHGNALLELGCELAQGYAIARPMEAKHILDWIYAWEVDFEEKQK